MPDGLSSQLAPAASPTRVVEGELEAGLEMPRVGGLLQQLGRLCRHSRLQLRHTFAERVLRAPGRTDRRSHRSSAIEQAPSAVEERGRDDHGENGPEDTQQHLDGQDGTDQ